MVDIRGRILAEFESSFLGVKGGSMVGKAEVKSKSNTTLRLDTSLYKLCYPHPQYRQVNGSEVVYKYN